MSSARSRKFRNDFYDRIYRAEVAKNPRLAEERLEEAKRRAEMPPMTPLRTSGTIGSWKGYHNNFFGGNYNIVDGNYAAQVRNGQIAREQDALPVERRLVINGVEYWFMGGNNFNRGDGVHYYEAPRRERNEAPQWEVNFTPDPTVRFETPVAPKEPDICDIINLDD